jgi:Txe/YoeB family toxin of toxin-antitoxin system
MNEPWKILYTKQALKDKRIACEAGFQKKVSEVLTVLIDDPFTEYPPYEKLSGDLSGAYSRRMNLQHRVVYQVYAEQRIIKIISMWLHYE